MGYSTKNTAKHERKLGMDAMRAMVNADNFDPQAALALAQANKDAFIKLDDLSDAKFCDCMQDMRVNHPDIYPVFWWWRDAEVKAGRLKEDDCDASDDRRHRTFMITQFLRAPFSDEWEDDRTTLKPGVDPWITEEQIIAGLDHKTIKRWAWIWHGRDIYTEEDEITDRTGRIKAGEKKFKHAHIMVEIPSKVTVEVVARWFGVPPQQVKIMRGRGSFMDGVEYLPHESPKAIEQFKTHYDDDEMHASPGFDFRQELQDLQAHRAKYGKRAGDMTPADTMRMHVMQDGWTMKQCRDDDPLTYAKIRSTLPGLRLDYLLDAPPCPFRLNIYVDGPGGTGKSSFCRYIAQMLFQGYESPYFTIGNDERVTFDGYDGQPAIIWDDARVVSLIKQFGREGVFRLLDPHPDNIAQQAKHSRVILCNAVNIINGVQPYTDFISGLAGNYTDRDGNEHKAEDENQAWRRIPMILRVSSEDFTVLLNKGFVDNDLSSVQTMYQYAHVRGRMKAMMEKLEGSAQQAALITFGQPVLTGIEEIKKSHLGEKISDPDKIPPELMPVVTYQADSVNNIGEDIINKAYAEHNARAALRDEAWMDLLANFAVSFWMRFDSGFEWYMEHSPDDWDNPALDAKLVLDDEDGLRAAVEYAKQRFDSVTFIDGHRFTFRDMCPDYPVQHLVDAVKAAWYDCYGPCKTIYDSKHFPAWMKEKFFLSPKDKHRVCTNCWLTYIPSIHYCGQCGKPLSEKVYTGDPHFTVAQLQIAAERGCDAKDVPYEAIKARVYRLSEDDGDQGRIDPYSEFGPHPAYYLDP